MAIIKFTNLDVPINLHFLKQAMVSVCRLCCGQSCLEVNPELREEWCRWIIRKGPDSECVQEAAQGLLTSKRQKSRPSPPQCWGLVVLKTHCAPRDWARNKGELDFGHLLYLSSNKGIGEAVQMWFMGASVPLLSFCV